MILSLFDRVIARVFKGELNSHPRATTVSARGGRTNARKHARRFLVCC